LPLASSASAFPRSLLCWPGQRSAGVAERLQTSPAPTAPAGPSGLLLVEAPGAGQLAGFHRRPGRHRAGRRSLEVGGTQRRVALALAARQRAPDPCCAGGCRWRPSARGPDGGRIARPQGSRLARKLGERLRATRGRKRPRSRNGFRGSQAAADKAPPAATGVPAVNEADLQAGAVVSLGLAWWRAGRLESSRLPNQGDWPTSGGQPRCCGGCWSAAASPERGAAWFALHRQRPCCGRRLRAWDSPSDYSAPARLRQRPARVC